MGKTTKEEINDWEERHPEGIKVEYQIPSKDVKMAERFVIGYDPYQQPKLSEQIRAKIGTPDEPSYLWNWFKTAQGLEKMIEDRDRLIQELMIERNAATLALAKHIQSNN